MCHILQEISLHFSKLGYMYTPLVHDVIPLLLLKLDLKPVFAMTL